LFSFYNFNLNSPSVYTSSVHSLSAQTGILNTMLHILHISNYFSVLRIPANLLSYIFLLQIDGLGLSWRVKKILSLLIEKTKNKACFLFLVFVRMPSRYWSGV